MWGDAIQLGGEGPHPPALAADPVQENSKDQPAVLVCKCWHLWPVAPRVHEAKRLQPVGFSYAGCGLHLGKTIPPERAVLGRGSQENAVKSPPQKMQEEVRRQVVYWQTEFDMDKWSVAGVLFDIAMDLLMVIEVEDEEVEE